MIEVERALENPHLQRTFHHDRDFATAIATGAVSIGSN